MLGMFRVTIWSIDDEFALPLKEPLQRGGLQVHRVAPSEGWKPDPAAAPDVLLIDWREMVPRARVEAFEAWPDSLRLAVVRPRGMDELEPSHQLDDFAVAPLREAELVARVQLLLWRHGRAVGRNTLSAGELVLDVSNYQVFEGGRALTLTFKEFELLRFLMTHTQQVFTRETLLNRVWGYNYYGGSRTVDVHIRRLRSKLEARGRTYLETVRNVGYRFAEEPRTH